MLSGSCVITGGGRGIGAATARRLATDQPGWTQILTWVHDRTAAETVASEVRAAGVEAVTVRADVADETDVLGMFAAADEAGPVRALVNNAGLLFPIARVEDLDAERITRTLAVNVTGSILCAREAVRRMSTDRGGQGGAIVNVSSRAATLGSPGEFVDYAASKGAVDTFTIGLAAEVAASGIRVNSVRPGLIDTDIHASAGRPDRVAALADRIPMGRGGTADEVAATIAWLLSDDASYVTGALIDIGGGR
jgi:NAD(P)-dependent dehydrogenase (short-subunit alcohol dehydrogenase family)